ncbi:hypothetical protein PMIN06_008796 [Paraphaeosphaeria minitans]
MTTLAGYLITESIQNFMQYAGNIGNGAIAKNNAWDITIFVDDLVMIEGDGNLSTFNLGPLNMVEASNFFAGFHALQVVRLYSTMPVVQEAAQQSITRVCSLRSAELAKKLDQVMTWKFEIVQSAHMKRNDKVDGIQFRGLALTLD